MMGIRVTDLAKELEISVEAAITALSDLGSAVAGPAAIIDGETAQMIRELHAPQGSGAKVIEVPAGATVKDIATAIGVPPADVQKKLMAMGVLAPVNQRLGADVARNLAGAYGVTLKPIVEQKPVSTTAPKHRSPSGGLTARPPVVTIMGHVDHGKTTLLDRIRNTNVVAGEFGGITQHIGAYQVEVDYEGERRKISFLDTPGHAAFTQMRARGASVTDIAVLVVAADDGIMPQTVEAIDHARAAEVPIIIAMNKIDKPESTPDRIKTQLTEHNLVPREYGGDIECLPVSAKRGDGVEDLLDHILFQADLMELKADSHATPSGVIVEARQEIGRGAVATVLVQQGTLRDGDNVVCGLAYGKVRSMQNERGERLHKASPATPVEITGLSSVPLAGDRLERVKDERTARLLAEQRALKQRQLRLATAQRVTLEDIYRRIREGEEKQLNLVVKADVQGSVEAVVTQLQQLPQDEVRLQVIHSGVGNIGENDIMLASASSAVVVGFNVRADVQAQSAAEREHIDVRSYQVIYELTESIERAMKGLLAPVFEEIELGKAEVRQVFRTPKGIIIAGCYVTEGKILRNADARIRRGRDLVFTGKIGSLKHIKDDVREMAQGFECGIVIDNFTDVKVGDFIDAFETRQVDRV